MPLKEDGNYLQRTVVVDKDDYSKLGERALKNKEEKKSLNNISKLLRDAVKKYVADYSKLEMYTKKELRNYFTLEEANLLIDAFKNVIYDVNTISPKIVMLSNAKDSIEFNKLDEAFKVDKDVILNKVNNLSEFQCYIVIKLIDEYKEIIQVQKNISEDELIKRLFLIS